jgi:hypothetical protein
VVRHVRTWLIAQGGAQPDRSALIQGKYLAFHESYWERELAAGSSEEDIREYLTVELIRATHE